VPGFLRRVRDDIHRVARHLMLNWVAGSVLLPRDARFALYKMVGIKCDGRVNVYPGVHIETNRLHLGRHVMINQGVWIDNMDDVSIGNNTSIGHQTMICTTSHLLGGAERRAGAVVSMPTHIGSGCWIGARCVVLPGVTIADGCVIAAGATVSKSTDRNGLYAGVPARRIRDI
jgi:maltose O-acetyltransferase